MAVYRFAYIAALAAAVVFSQAYAGHLSSVMLITFAVLPAVSFIFTFTAKIAFFFRFDISEDTVEKNNPLKVRIFIKNRFIFPSSTTYIKASMPGFSEKKDARIIFSLAPFQTKNLNLTYTAEYRGEYDVSFDTVYFYDYLKLFRLKKELRLHKKITVTPRIIDVSAVGGLITASDEENEKQALNSVRGERSFTRKYAEGDDVRNIHWKLSAKQDDYMVWQNAENLSSQAVIVCDLISRGETEKEKAAYTDAVLESALAVALYNMKNDCGSLLSFYNADKGQMTDINTEHMSHLYNAAYMAATVKDYKGEPSFYSSCKRHFTDITKSAAILVTPHGNKELAKLAEELAALSEVRILLLGEAETGVKRYLDTLRNVAVAEVDPFNIDAEIDEAIRKLYGKI